MSDKSVLKHEVVKQALEDLTSKEGTIRPEDVVAAARAKDHPLHRFFEWDNRKAGQEHRLRQAQELIRYVKVSFGTQEQKVVVVRMYESLPSDRKIGAGYRSIRTIMRSEEMRTELLQSARLELESFRVRYQHLVELADVMRAIDRSVERAEAQAARREARGGKHQSKPVRKTSGRKATRPSARAVA